MKGMRLVTVLLFFGFAEGCSSALLPHPAPLTPNGLTYGRAQAIAWLDADNFLVSRWDGTLTIFQALRVNGAPPLLQDVLMLPSQQAAEMVVALAPGAFVTSNDQGSLAVWEKHGPHYAVVEVAYYDPGYGVANSATIVEADGSQWLVTGHAEGMVVVWALTARTLREVRAVSIRWANPFIPDHFGVLWNVRSLVTWKHGIVISASEDGDLCMIRVPDGTLLARVRYNAAAQRGINSVALWNEYLVVANCSIGANDRNLWLYKIDVDGLRPLHSVNLLKETGLLKAFNFSVQLADVDGRLSFFASTEEGLLWMGTIVNDKLVPLASTKVACEWGAAVAFQPSRKLLAAAAHDVRLYMIPRLQ
jgi:hypothetical protein